MTTVKDTIPEHLAEDARAALRWWNADQDLPFEVTGIIDPDSAVSENARELRLVLCGGDRCEQRTFRVEGGPEARSVSLIEEKTSTAGDGGLVPELDPPPGARRGWLARALDRHAFVVLVFYRGFW